MNVDNWPDLLPRWRVRKEANKAHLDQRYLELRNICANCQFPHQVRSAAAGGGFFVDFKTHDTAWVVLTDKIKLKLKFSLNRIIFMDIN